MLDYKKLTHDDRVELGYLIHGKEHLILTGKKSKGIEKGLKYYSEISNKPLYRGIYDIEKKMFGQFKIGKKIAPKRYSSFSENLSVAAYFAKNESNVLFVLKNGVGFCYWKYMAWQLDDIKKTDPKEYRSIDGNGLMKTINEEKEWVTSTDSVYVITNVKGRKGYTVVEIEPASAPQRKK